jgi:hypothetical protein
MSDASDSQNASGEGSIDLSAGSSPEESYHEGERSSPDLPKAATRSRKKKNSDDEDKDFVAKEVIPKKKKTVIAKEYDTGSSARPAASKSMAKAAGKKRVRKETAQVVFKPTSMRRDDI